MILISVFVVVYVRLIFLGVLFADCAHQPESIEGRFCAHSFPRKRGIQDFPAQGLDARLRGHDDSDMRRHSAIYRVLNKSVKAFASANSSSLSTVSMILPIFGSFSTRAALSRNFPTHSSRGNG